MWKPLGAVAPGDLEPARLLVHWASQIVSAAGTSLLEAKADFSHTNLGWDAAIGGLTTHPLGADSTGDVQAALLVSSLELAIVVGGEVTQRHSLDGQDLEAGLSWLTKALGEALGAEKSLVRPEHEMPDHPVAAGGAFAADGHGPAFAELARWLGNSASVLERFARGDAQAAPVRLWPHHFDMATLVTLVAHDDPEEAKSVGVGVSYGDGSYAQPYVYVTPWPYPEPKQSDETLHAGHWHTEGFFAAVLTGDELLAGGGEGQAQRMETFAAQAYGASRRIVGLGAAPIRSPKLVWFKAAELDELPEGRVKTVTAGLDTVCLTHYEGCYAAVDNRCPHQGGPLGEGSIEKGWLRCPWHGWDFHPTTGQSPDGLDDGIDTFPVEVRDDGVYVGLEAEPPHVRTSTDVMAETMVAWGVKWVFGMVGHSNLGLADAIRRQVDAGKMGYVGIRHEGAASFAVSAYGKLTGRPAACLAIAGPGATNLLTGLWDANVDRAPAIALTGQVQTQVLGRGAFQEVDLKAAFGGVAQWTATVLHDGPYGELMSLACKHATLGRGVTHLIFPDEVQNLPSEMATASPEGRMPDLTVTPSATSLDAAEAALRAAKRPVIIVGHGARFSMDAITAFAETHGIPVITTFKGKGLIADTHALGCGVLGRSGTPIASWFMNEADLLFVLGSSFSNHTGITDYKTIVQVDFEAEALGRKHPVTVPVLGEIGVTMAALAERLKDAKMSDFRDEVAERWKIWRDEKTSRLSDDGGHGLNSASIFAALSDAVPDDAIIAVDVGNNTYSFGRYFETKQQSILMSGYLGSIGFALPAAMGAWVATQEDDPRFKGRKVVSVSGDGGLGQYLADLNTWVKYGMNITHVVLNNGQLGKISKEQRGGHWQVWETSLHNPDFSKYAENCGALGIRVTTADALPGALAKALAHEGPALVEILSDALLF